ncbi:helix-turn-helix transcriptional regulator [Candidatus Fukatsuia symbiotica]|uniref:Transcriptional regulator n=1 Tax=Candidatus Fukatsuia symbiotica TaxID=1878942 RepID=A0A2U8I9B1_9GAMM|nr:helix-turn-helix transcriptional regulator [Candidatus Fukatsuia symbiotica]AWK15742.1 transcriptional regulator [Candidatus Fukatsuia symbiotica]MEA9446055.1 helix-turn-helix transcriptional regulator [Candidatus Fukatsuia symbiotica]
MKNCDQQGCLGVTGGSTVEISPQIILMCENSRDPWAIKDLESRFIYGNKANAALLNLPSKFDIESRLDSEIPNPTADFACNFQEHDRKVIELKQNISSLDIYTYGREQITQPYISEKSPLHNQDGKCIGVIFHIRKCHFFPTTSFIGGKLPCSLVFDPPEDLFTKDELEVVFLAIHRMSAKEIAKELDLLDRTIEKRLGNIYRKIGVSFLRQLIDYCQTKGFDRYIPPRFFKPGSKFIDYMQ